MEDPIRICKENEIAILGDTYYGINGKIYEEVWVDIDQELFPDILPIYRISNMGRIFNIQKNRLFDPYVLNTSNPYLCVNLQSYDKKGRKILVHRLVAFHFIPRTDPQRNYVNHMNCNVQMNIQHNLEWVTNKENFDHAMMNGRVPLGENRTNSKFTDDQVISICEMLQDGKLSYTEILRMIGMETTDNNRDMIGNIKRGKAWRHISCNYTFDKSDRDKRFSDEQYHKICQMIQSGYSNREIAIEFGIDMSSDKAKEAFYAIVRSIKARKTHIDISKNYIF